MGKCVTTLNLTTHIAISKREEDFEAEPTDPQKEPQSEKKDKIQ